MPDTTKSTDPKKILYAAADDSNHAGLGKKGEIIVLTLSSEKDDGAVRKYANRRDYSVLQDWDGLQNRDYRFTVLTDAAAAKRGYNLVLVAPLLLRDYITKNPDPSIDFLKIFLDGPLQVHQKEFIYKDKTFDRNKSSFEGIIKREHKVSDRGRKRTISFVKTPRVLVAADTIAHHLYTSMTLEALLADPRYVSISQEEVLERDRMLRNS